jgi:prevent-host-death family protein
VKTVTATEMKQRLGQYLTAALVEPFVVEKSGQPVVVMLSMAEYERLQALEDAYWGSAPARLNRAVSQAMKQRSAGFRNG